MVRHDAHRENALKAANGRSRRRTFSGGWLWDWAKGVLLAVVLFVGVRTFAVDAYKIPSGSMERTLLAGDFVLVNTWGYRRVALPWSRGRVPPARAPQDGDIVVFAWPSDPTTHFVKRVVGRPGDTLSMQGGTLWRNGVRLQERYVSHAEPQVDPMVDDFRWQRGYLTSTALAADRVMGIPPIYRPSRDNWGPLVVPPEQLFVLGDNRDRSLDSRYWGFVPDHLLRGTPLVVYFSVIPNRSAPASWLSRVRWARLGSRVR
jgi:signal peptidase I